MRFLKALWLAVFFFFSLIFFIQNNEALGTPLMLKFDFYFGYIWTGTAVPFYFVVLAGFFAGCLVTLGYLVMDRIRLRLDLRRSRKQVRVLEREIKNLREIPLHTPTLIESAPVDGKEEKAA